MSYRDFVRLPNLLSLVRIPMGLATWPLLAADSPLAGWLAVGLIIAAGITDGLDGYVARQRDQVTALGIALDPICDKVFAVVLVGGLILYRDFPVWLGIGVVARDVVIVAGGLYLSPRGRISLPSNLPGKYAFAALAVLLGSSAARFAFGVVLLTWIVVVLLVVSLVCYARVFFEVRKGGEVSKHPPTPRGRAVRLALTCAFSAVYLYRLYTDIVAPLIGR